MINDRKNEEDFAENDKRGIDNPELNRDQNNSKDKDRDFDEAAEEDENDDFHTNGLDDEHSLSDDDPNETKPYKKSNGNDN